MKIAVSENGLCLVVGSAPLNVDAIGVNVAGGSSSVKPVQTFERGNASAAVPAVSESDLLRKEAASAARRGGSFCAETTLERRSNHRL